MKLSMYARTIGVTYKTAHRWWKAGKLDAYQLDTGTIIVRPPENATEKQVAHVALYARVSSADQKNDLERQMERLKDYAADLPVWFPLLAAGCYPQPTGD
jgi:predicted site-specific integrase-resolvase